MSRHIIVIIHDWEPMLNRHPRFLEIHCRRGGRSRVRKSHLTRSLVASEGWSRRWSGIVQTENSARHTKYGRIRGMIVGVVGTKHTFAKQCLKHNLPKTLNSIPKIVKDKIGTHSFRGFINYAKDSFIKK